MVVLVTFVSAGIGAGAEDEALLARLDQALTAVPGFEHGQNSAPLVGDRTVRVCAGPGFVALRGPVEQRLLETLRSATTRDAKSFLCQQLHVVGTRKSVAALEELLTDPDAAHAARIVLGRLEDPAALEALHRALQKTSGKLQAGILHTLADRRHRAAEPDCARLLASSDPDVTLAAARALGVLGGDQAVRALREARAKPTDRWPPRSTTDCSIARHNWCQRAKAPRPRPSTNPFTRPINRSTCGSAGLRGLVMAQPERPPTCWSMPSANRPGAGPVCHFAGGKGPGT
jgi:hypothetical protein